ncbi:MAG: MoxR family ATPase [Nanoarchaeota archaeon]|nr:MoxR family ATPase [Nanoarchaeota archaeon]
MAESQTKDSINEGFIFDDHTVVTSIDSFLKKIKTLSNIEVLHYITDKKNDFSHWIGEGLENKKLASLISKEKSKDGVIGVLETYLAMKDNTGNIPIKSSKPKTEIKKVETPKPKEIPKVKGRDLFSTEDFHPDEFKKHTQPISKEKEYSPKSKVVQGPVGKEEVLTEKEAEEASEELRNAVDEIGHVCIGQQLVIQKIFLCLICDGHALLEGVPGLAKSLLVETLAQVVNNASFHRIQFMPDLLPSDIIGGQIYNPKTATFTTYKGPIFANFILADEVNRAPPKTNAALMECMQEKKVNIDKDEYILDKPFLVLGTQNPLENKGTYALPEAVLDRFMFKIILDYPSRKDEKIIITENSTTNRGLKKRANTVFSKERLLELQGLTRKIFISERIRDYILDLVDATRGLNKNVEGFKFVKYGGGPRASIYLGIAAKAKALYEGRNYVMPDDVAFVAPEVLRHRVCLNYNGKAHNISSDKIVEEILGIINPV